MQENSKEFVEYKSFDELPDELKEKFKSGARGLKLDEAKNGYLGFINQLNECGDEFVGVYIGATTKTQVKFGKCGHVVDISPANYKSGKDCAVCRGLRVHSGVNDLATLYPSLAKEWHPTKNGKLTPYNITHGSDKKVWWRCEYGHEWVTKVGHRTYMGSNCPYCSNQKVLKGYNDIATTHPHYVKYFVNVNDANFHTHSSGKKVELKCPDCGHTKTMSIDTLTHRGFSCDLCSDGYSFPEKLMTSILTKLNIEFIKQMSYDNGDHKYDFYLPDYNVILETHGGQHYKGWLGDEEDLLQQQENDEYKRQLAVENGMINENYHEIDCRYSTLEWCRPNIKKALGDYIDMSILTDEDWKEADIQAQKSLKIEVCKHWKENKEVGNTITAQHSAKVFGVEVSTIRNYLNWGSANGFCKYEGKDEKEASVRRRSIFVYLIDPNGNKWFDESMSMAELSRQTGIVRSTIAINLDKGALKYNHKAKYDPKYIGSRIVSAEAYDNQHQSNQNT